MAKCESCGRVYEYDREKGHRKTKCNSCRQRDRRRRRRRKLIDDKGGRCKECGYDDCYRALDFHHKDPSNKKFQISGNETKAKEKVEKEAEKCILLCKNCHTQHDCRNCSFEAEVA